MHIAAHFSRLTVKRDALHTITMIYYRNGLVLKIVSALRSFLHDKLNS